MIESLIQIHNYQKQISLQDTEQPVIVNRKKNFMVLINDTDYSHIHRRTTKKFSNIINIILLILLLIIPTGSFAQLHLIRYDSITVSINDIQLTNAWAGGLNSPQFSEIDLNGDGIKDLFVFERDWNGIIKTFINNGQSGQIDYTYQPYYQQKFPEMHNWCLLADYNCDGKEDIFTSVPAGIAVYRNDSDQSGLKFTLVSPLLLSTGSDGLTPVYVSPPDIPALTDVDGDGDLDILSFGVLGKSVKYHKNLSMENYGNCEHLEFEIDSECWGYFSESSQDNSITLFDTCTDIQTREIGNNKHAGSALLSIDLNGNGLKDLLLGDISYNNLVMLTNGGSSTEASMISVENNFPVNSTAVDLTVFPAAFSLDVNNDNKRDLLISPNNPNTSENINNIWLYENIGTESIPIFEIKNKSFLQNQMIDMGEGARPVFFDANADGLVDILVGNYGYFIESGNFDSKLGLFLNNGTHTKPSFVLAETDYSNLSELNFNGVYPTFGDMDSDGDQDMIIGDEEGNLHLFINTASIGLPAEFSLSKPVYMNIDVGETAIPQIIDVNRDGKPDLLVGEISGTLNYFENTGTNENAFFSSSPTNDFFGGIDVMPECCSGYSAPFLTEDSVGNHLLYVGSETGWLYQFNDIEGNIDGSFAIIDSLFLNGLNITISGADINNNEQIELIYGEYAGGIAILQKGVPEWIGINEDKAVSLDIKIFPNPTHSKVKIQFLANEQNGSVEIQLFNFQGKTVSSSTHNVTGNFIEIDLEETLPGLYFVKIQTNGKVKTMKLIVN